MLKHCTTCKKDKPIEQFSVDKNNKDGRKYECKYCQSIRQGKYSGDYKARIYFKNHYGLDPERYPKQFEEVKKWYQINNSLI